ncbi:recombinase family protein [Streptomyces sp. NPDC048636]|uniref:recombinase family protein n=1 Tax=Streptomyces sp. NPDC048636 TaxID=3155762 RepID=UPI003438DA83
MKSDETAASAYIYDRETTSADNADERIAVCRDYAARMGWNVAGQWVDRGDNAVSARRMQWVGMLAAMDFETPGRQPVCLVASWDRIARDASLRAEFRQMVSKINGVCVSVADRVPESDVIPSAVHRG